MRHDIAQNETKFIISSIFVLQSLPLTFFTKDYQIFVLKMLPNCGQFCNALETLEVSTLIFVKVFLNIKKCLPEILQ